jgi:MFS transporter, OFA family, oxalate/formate antiporter
MKNRWLLALCAVGIHISIGSVYAWSQIAVSIKKQLTVQWGIGQITLTFAIAICALGLAAAFMGHFVEKKGPKASGMLSAVLFGAGLVGAGIALKMENIWLLYLTYGVLGGVGIGIGYITPVSTLLKWFPDKRGLAMGMAIMGFGFGAAIEIFILQNILPSLGITSISNGVIILGVLYFVLIFISSLYLAPPPKDWVPKGYTPDLENNGKQKVIKQDLENLFANEAVRKIRFYYLWLMLFINVCCGIALISVAKFMGHDVIMLSSQAAAVMVMLMSVFNGCGRIFWASISDYISRPITYITFFVIQIIAFFVLTQTTNAILFQAVVFVILTCYGGGFSVAPAYIGDIFGTKQPGAIHGYILTAWAAAGLVGPTLIAFTKQITGSYHDALYVFIVFLIVAFIISLLMIANIRKIEKNKGIKDIIG